jgi:hypothetical protein
MVWNDGIQRGSAVSDGGVFRVGADGELTLLGPSKHETEARFQEALARYPEVIAGFATSGEANGRLLLVANEAEILTATEEQRSFAIDHLFVDSNAVPVLVEVKRSSDTRIRREVVGQMLDYAANARVTWTADSLREAFAATCEVLDRSGEAELTALFDGDGAPADFWSDVHANVSSGRMRLVFVADELPESLVRVIEFLNEQMSPAEVLGVEILQYRSTGPEPEVVYVPRLVGATTKAKAAKDRVSGTKWSAQSVLEAVDEFHPEHRPAFERILAHVERYGSQIRWGTGVTAGFSAWYPLGDTPRPVYYVNAGTPTEMCRVEVWADMVEQDVGAEAYAKFVQELSHLPVFGPSLAKGRKEPSARFSDWSEADWGGFLSAVEALRRGGDTP